MRARPAPASILALALLAAAVPATAQAGGAGGYLYDRSGAPLPCPLPYEPAGLIVFPRLPCGPLDFPQDLAVDANGDLYVADAGNARVLKLTSAGTLLLEIRHPALQKPVGLFVARPEDGLWVADGSTGCILGFDAAGRLVSTVAPPRSDVLPAGFLYSPSRILVDDRGWLLVIGTGSSGGIIQIDPAGTFQGFFGANPASTDLLRRIVRAVASPEQRRAGQRLQTLEPYTDFELAEDGSVVAVTESLATGQIRRLNALGVSTFPAIACGEQSPDATGRVLEQARLAFITSDRQGILTVMDRATLRMFQYSRDGDLLFAWGGRGTQRGTYQSAAAIATDRGTGVLYVLDGTANMVQALRPTQFAELVHQGSALYAEGRYEEALRTWVEVRRRDATYPLANRGIGKVLLRLGTRLGRSDYLRASMDYYRQAGDRVRFSEAFAVARRLWTQAALPALLVLVAAAAAAAVAASAVRRRRAGRPGAGRAVRRSPFALWRVLTHPVQVMQEVRWEYGADTRRASLLALGLYAAAQIAARAGTGFQFTDPSSDRINLAAEAGRLLLPWITWVGANYLVTTILRGEGTVGRIFCASAYALVPLAAATVLRLALSHVLSLEEVSVYRAVGTIGAAWSGLLFLVGSSTIHDYRAPATVGTTLLSLAGIVILWGIGVLILGLVSTAVGFVIDVVREVSSRA